MFIRLSLGKLLLVNLLQVVKRTYTPLVSNQITAGLSRPYLDTSSLASRNHLRSAGVATSILARVTTSASPPTPPTGIHPYLRPTLEVLRQHQGAVPRPALLPLAALVVDGPRHRLHQPHPRSLTIPQQWFRFLCVFFQSPRCWSGRVSGGVGWGGVRRG